MSPIEAHRNMLSSLQLEMKNRDGVHSLEVRHDPHSGLGPDDTIHGRDVVRVRLLPAHQNPESKKMMKEFFWKKVLEIGIDSGRVALEMDDKEYPVWDPPL